LLLQAEATISFNVAIVAVDASYTPSLLKLYALCAVSEAGLAPSLLVPLLRVIKSIALMNYTAHKGT